MVTWGGRTRMDTGGGHGWSPGEGGGNTHPGAGRLLPQPCPHPNDPIALLRITPAESSLAAAGGVADAWDRPSGRSATPSGLGVAPRGLTGKPGGSLPSAPAGLRSPEGTRTDSRGCAGPGNSQEAGGGLGTARAGARRGGLRGGRLEGSARRTGRGRSGCRAPCVMFCSGSV